MFMSRSLRAMPSVLNVVDKQHWVLLASVAVGVVIALSLIVLLKNSYRLKAVI